MSNKLDNKKSLKSQNSNYLRIFILFNIVVFVAVIIENKISFENFQSLWSKITLKDGLLITIVPLLSIILNGIISSHFKAVLVFWRLKNPLPGCRAFSQIAVKDSRINLTNIIKHLDNDEPKTPAEQNRSFYRLYKTFQDKISVKESHKQFLLMRDISAISFIFWVIFLILFFIINKNFVLEIYYLGYLFLQFIISSFVARNYGNRFVGNVMAEASII